MYDDSVPRRERALAQGLKLRDRSSGTEAQGQRTRCITTVLPRVPMTA